MRVVTHQLLLEHCMIAPHGAVRLVKGVCLRESEQSDYERATQEESHG